MTPATSGRIHAWFRFFAQWAANLMGSPWSFLAAVLLILFWGVFGPLFNFSDSWQLVINTGTTIITFLMVFLIQHTQNRDARAFHLKLDELIRATKGARNNMIDLDGLSEDELEKLRKQFDRIGQRHDQTAPLKTPE